VFSFELLAYRELINHNAMPAARRRREAAEYFTTADDITRASTWTSRRRAEVDRLLDLEDGERSHGLPLRRFQGHLPLRA